MNSGEKAENIICVYTNEYQPPEVEVMEVLVEQGFAATGPIGTGSDLPWG